MSNGRLTAMLTYLDVGLMAVLLLSGWLGLRRGLRLAMVSWPVRWVLAYFAAHFAMIFVFIQFARYQELAKQLGARM
jgi:hypothetical protein